MPNSGTKGSDRIPEPRDERPMLRLGLTFGVPIKGDPKRQKRDDSLGRLARVVMAKVSEPGTDKAA